MKDLFLISRYPKDMEKAGYFRIKKYRMTESDDIYIYSNTGSWNKLKDKTKKDIMYTHKLFL
ncbi:MAG: hypothetical protein E6147_03380 [Peptostreptococcus sp.]|uniref:hypothetical protein n=1 Tax=Peptostreptococcus sp. TaxID=1262 RepID=UPI002915870E|nr:hypothetical protein [Peptostreptococcus sp.]MDU5350017.1 hypothetical protein [Peptostreptococcus sp.]MDU5891507.1 hypothetical protein [Peptostreptococcus sp.]